MIEAQHSYGSEKLTVLHICHRRFEQFKTLYMWTLYFGRLAPKAKWSKALPLNAGCLSILPRFKLRSRHVRKLPVTNGVGYRVHLGTWDSCITYNCRVQHRLQNIIPLAGQAAKPLQLALPTCSATLKKKGEIGLCPKHYLLGGASQGLVQLAP